MKKTISIFESFNSPNQSAMCILKAIEQLNNSNTTIIAEITDTSKSAAFDAIIRELQGLLHMYKISNTIYIKSIGYENKQRIWN